MVCNRLLPKFPKLIPPPRLWWPTDTSIWPSTALEGDETLYIYIWDGSVIQSGVALGLNHVKVVWFVPSCYPGSANSSLLHSFDGLKTHPYGHPLHCKVMEHLIYIWERSVIQSEMDYCLNHIIVVWFVTSCYPGLGLGERTYIIK